MRFDLPTMNEIQSAGAPAATAGPMQLSVDDIDEDPDQPRQEFDDESLTQLAATIAGRGVRQPVSVRRHPNRPGRWMLNFGARRLRAAKIAGEATIAAFEDAAPDSYDQVIENEQREGLTPLELALFVERQLRRGASRADIAKGIGKSQPYITYACSLIDAPGWLMDLYRSGKCRGMFELHELRRLHHSHGAAVQAAVGSAERFGRGELQRLKTRLLPRDQKAPKEGRPRSDLSSDLSSASGSNRRNPSAGAPTAGPCQAAQSAGDEARPGFAGRRVSLVASHGEAQMRVVQDEVPDAPDSVWLESDKGVRLVALIDELRLKLVIECTVQA